MTDSRTFSREIDALSGVFDFTGEFADRHALGASVVYAMNLAIEELFTNIVKYGQRNGADIGVELGVRDGYLVIEITDGDAEPFDITAAANVDVGKGLAEREAGGLGIHLIRSIMDYIRYEYENHHARITLKKCLEDKDV